MYIYNDIRVIKYKIYSERNNFYFLIPIFIKTQRSKKKVYTNVWLKSQKNIVSNTTLNKMDCPRWSEEGSSLSRMVYFISVIRDWGVWGEEAWVLAFLSFQTEYIEVWYTSVRITTMLGSRKGLRLPNHDKVASKEDSMGKFSLLRK